MTWIVLGLLAIAINLPFLGQAFHIDDPVFLKVAENTSRDPLFAQDLPILFEGVSVPDLASAEHPPLIAWYMALAARLGGGFSEVVLHTAFLLFPAILAVATYSLARRFTSSPAIATVALLVSPVVFVMSHTLMTDLPLMALWTASVALFVHGLDSGRMRWAWIGGITAALATFASYAGLCLVPLLAAYSVLKKQPAGLLPSMLPVPAFGAWLALNAVHYGRFTPGPLLNHYLFVEKVLAPGLIGDKLIYAVVVLGGATLFPLALVALGTVRRIVAGFLLAVALVFITEVRAYDLPAAACFVGLFSAGFVALWEIFRSFGRSLRSLRSLPSEAADDLFLGLWFTGALAFCVLVYLTGAARYLLPAVPPFILMVVRRAELRTGGRLLHLAVPALFATAIMALAAATADFQFARIYREFAGSLAASAASREPGRRVWFTGEWGFRAYLERLGGRELGRRDPRPRPGDRLIVPTLATPYPTLFSDRLGLDCIVLVAPSRVSFELPAVQAGDVLSFTVGMPLHDVSDGLDLGVLFVSGKDREWIRRERLEPQSGRRWTEWNLPLDPWKGRKGTIVFSARVGSSGRADGDWVALARARIEGAPTAGGPARFDFLQHFEQASV
ncbi:MAG: glycosyltransferase family 39 protein, partial [Acidobacteriota bacterium]